MADVTYARIRAVAAAQGALGGFLCARPDAVLPLVSGSGDRPAAWIVRVLGARMTAQSIVTAIRPDSRVVLAGGATDVVHSASMIALGRLAPRYRRPALVSAATAFAFAVALGVAGRPR